MRDIFIFYFQRRRLLQNCSLFSDNKSNGIGDANVNEIAWTTNTDVRQRLTYDNNESSPFLTTDIPHLIV